MESLVKLLPALDSTQYFLLLLSYFSFWVKTSGWKLSLEALKPFCNDSSIEDFSINDKTANKHIYSKLLSRFRDSMNLEFVSKNACPNRTIPSILLTTTNKTTSENALITDVN